MLGWRRGGARQLLPGQLQSNKRGNPNSIERVQHCVEATIPFVRERQGRHLQTCPRALVSPGLERAPPRYCLPLSVLAAFIDALQL